MREKVLKKTDNNISDEGIIYIIESLKTNSTLSELNLGSK